MGEGGKYKQTDDKVILGSFFLLSYETLQIYDF